MSAQLHQAVPPALELQDLALRIAREMRVAAAIADDCQDAIGGVEDLLLDHEVAVRLQGLDLLSQQLIEIGRVLDRLVTAGLLGEAPPGLLDDVCLSDLRRRLGGESAAATQVLETTLW